MSQLLLAGLCGIAGGIIAALGALAFFMHKVKGSDCLMISRGPGPEIYKEVEILEHAPRPQGLYVRYRNCGTKPIQMTRTNLCCDDNSAACGLISVRGRWRRGARA